jgi:hypothetical protein
MVTKKPPGSRTRHDELGQRPGNEARHDPDDKSHGRSPEGARSDRPRSARIGAAEPRLWQDARDWASSLTG